MTNAKAKTIYTPELKDRLTAAKTNGSTVASALLEDLRLPKADVINSALADNFRTKRCVGGHGDYKSLSIKIGYCKKDFSNANNPDHGVPDASDRPGNLVWTSPSQFALMFKNRSFTHTELDYFNSAIKESTKVTIRIYDKFRDFERAYNGDNYSIFSDSDGPLQSSCMRYEGVSAIAADFYKNFCGCRIMIATNGNHEIVGRAIVWDGVEVYDHSTGRKLAENMSFLDRKYYSYAFVKTMMVEYAKQHGIDLIKSYDDISRQIEVTPTHDFAEFSAGESESMCLRKDVPQVKWHKTGAPYVDTLSNVMYDDGQVYLCNYYDGVGCHAKLAECRSTHGNADCKSKLCACCGETFTYSDCYGTGLWLCNDCYDRLFVATPFGKTYKGKCVKVQGKLIPQEVAKSGYFDLALKVGRLFNND